MHALTLFSIVDFSGVAVGAVGGALEARRHEQYHYDVVGVLGLAFLSALGGGITRDIILQHGPPLAFVDVRYLLVALAGGMVGVLFGSSAGPRTRRFMLTVDAAALGLFAVAGAIRALNADLSVLPALLLGVTTAVGGGSLRDVFMGRTPRIFERGEPYAIAATIAVVAFLLVDFLGFSRTDSTATGAGVGFLVRVLALQFGWRTRRVS